MESLPRSVALVGQTVLSCAGVVERMGEVVADRHYRRQTWQRDVDDVVLTLTVAGAGLVEDPVTAWAQRLTPGDLFFFRGNRDRLVYRHEASGGPRWHALFVNFAGAAIDEIAERMIAEVGHVCACRQARRFRQSVEDRLPARGWSDVLVSVPEALRIAQGFIDILVDAWQHAAGHPDPLPQQAMAHMLADLADPPGIAAVADRVGMTREHFSRRFRERIGQPPADWLRGRRLERGRELLQSTPRPIATIARACGFRSAAAFAQAYRQTFGRRPSDERRPVDSRQSK